MEVNSEDPQGEVSSPSRLNSPARWSLNRSQGSPDVFWLTRNRSLTFSGRRLTLKSKVVRDIAWDTHNVTITFAKHNDEVRV